MIRTCPFCEKEIEVKNNKVFANHVRWCDRNPERDRLKGDRYRNKIQALKDARIVFEFGDIKEFIVTCAKCGKQFSVFEREKKFPTKEKYFCSRGCANARKHTLVERIKISNGVKNSIKSGKTRKYFQLRQLEERICLWCGQKFSAWTSSKQRFCSCKCGARHREQVKYTSGLCNCLTDDDKLKREFRRYRNRCQFRFALKNFPLEFDFDLIKKFGWYKAKNRGNNIGGISRDHMYSVQDGFINNVDPAIISHPANCKLMPHGENSSKHNKSSITLEDLKKRIDKWNKKYNNSNIQNDLLP